MPLTQFLKEQSPPARMPWEKYSEQVVPSTATTATQGPWTKYQPIKKSREQVTAEVEAAQARVPIEQQAEEQGVVGRTMAGAEPFVESLSPQGWMRAVGTVAQEVMNLPARAYSAVMPKQTPPFVINRDTQTLSQGPKMPYNPEPFQQGVPTLRFPQSRAMQLGEVVEEPLTQVMREAIEGFTTPEGIATLPLATQTGTLGKAMAGLFMGQTVPEAGRQAIETFTAEDPRERELAAMRTVLSTLFSGLLGKQVAAEVPKPKANLRPGDFEPINVPFEERVGFEVNRPTIVRQSQGPTPIVGGEPYRPRQVFFDESGRTMEMPIVPTRAPVEPSGGEISFRAEAGAEAIPSARQSGLSEIPLRDVPEQERLMAGSFIPAGKLPEERLGALREQQRQQRLREKTVPPQSPLQPIKDVVQQPDMTEQLFGRQWERFKGWASESKDRYALEGALESWHKAPIDARSREAVKLLEDRLIDLQREQGYEGQTMKPSTKPTPVGIFDTVREVLTDISKDKTSPLNEISKELIRLGDKIGLDVKVLQKDLAPGVLGTYYPPNYSAAGEHIGIAKFLQGHDAHKTIVHEALHGFVWLKTDPAIRNTYKAGQLHTGALEQYLATGTDAATKDLIRAYLEAKRKFGHEGQGTYGMTDYAEFISEAWSNPKFQKFLQETKSILGGSLWDRMIKAVKRMLGINVKDTLLADVIRVSSDVVKRDRPTGPAALERAGPEAVFNEQREQQPKIGEQDASTLRSTEEQVPKSGDGQEVRTVKSGEGPQRVGKQTGEGTKGDKGVQTLLEEAQEVPDAPGRGVNAPRLYGPLGIDLKHLKPLGKAAKAIATKTAKVGANLIRSYSEPLIESIGRVGGPVSKKVTEEALQITSRGKELYGSITPVLDKAKKQFGKFLGAGTMWVRELNEVTDTAAYNNFFGVNEGVVTPPTSAKRALKLGDDANLAVGGLAKLANPGFVPSNKLQRIPTNAGYDFIVNGGEGRENWIKGIAKVNNKPIGSVKKFFNDWKIKLATSSSDAASLDKIAQDFKRKFPRTITHVKNETGWHEVLVSDPFNYLEESAQRTAHAAAFREVYPKDSGALDATRKAVLAELPSGSDIKKFDNLMKALQGHPLDTFKGDVSTTVGSVGGAIASPLKAVMLSANAPVNVGEVVSGGPAIFLGYKSVVPAMAEMVKDGSIYDQLEMTGARNKAMYNMAIDPSAPGRSTSRIFSSAVRKLTGQQFLNEVQETTAAASAKHYADRIRNKEMGRYMLNRSHALFRLMGFSKEQATKMINGNEALLRQFETKAASWLTGGNQAVAEMSRLGASRAFNSAFWFHKYPQMTSNQLRVNLGNWLDDVKDFSKKPTKDNWTPVYHNTALLARQLGGRGMQGIITLGVLAGVLGGGIYGLQNLANEAQDAPWRFAVDALSSAYGGPLAILRKLSQNVKSGDSLKKELSNLSPPVTIASEFIDMGLGAGKYQGLDKAEKVATFFEGKTPITKAGKTAMALGALIDHDVELETATKAFYRWRRQQPGFLPGSSGGGTPEELVLRRDLKQVVEKIENGGDWKTELAKVAADRGKVRDSINAQTLLEINGKPLDEGQIQKLKNRIGEKFVKKLQTRDALLREVARELGVKTPTGEVRKIETMAKPTGTKAIDFQTESKRSEIVFSRLSAPLQKFLTSNQVTELSYTPKVPGRLGKELLSTSEGKVMEDEFVKSLEELVGRLTANKNLEGQTPAIRQNIIRNMVRSAREVAQARTLKKVAAERSQGQ